MSTNEWDEVYDVVVVGSGAASLVASLVLRHSGLSVCVLEKSSQVGGTSAMSGGVVWIPDHPLQSHPEPGSDADDALIYMNALIGKGTLESSVSKREAFVSGARPMITFLERMGISFERCGDRPDYYDELPGASLRGRSLSSKLFDVRELGAWGDSLRRGSVSYPVTAAEVPVLMLGARTWTSAFLTIRVMLRIAAMKITGRKWVGLGTAIQGRLLKGALASGVRIEREATVTTLVEHGQRVVGVGARLRGRDVQIGARGGVFLGAGGFSRSQARREQYLPLPTSQAWSLACDGDTGEIMDEAVKMGGTMGGMNHAIWVPTSMPPAAGKMAMHGNAELAKPHVILVDSGGRRFVNEAGSYVEIGRKIYDRGGPPVWAIMDSRHRARYFWAGIRPGNIPITWLINGYMKQADSLGELAQLCGLNRDQLANTVARFNECAHSGYDADFGRGSRAFDRWWGDPTVRPNPSLGAIEKAPFHAVAIYPGDVGTMGGLITDENARVVRATGNTIEGLYAFGTCAASVMAGYYPGAGSSLGPSMVFGYIAARHLLDEWDGRV